MATPPVRNPHVRPVAIRWTSGDTLPVVDSTGGAMPLLVDSTTGALLTTGGGGGGSVDLTTTNALITSANADLALLDTAIGNPSDTTASSDSGTFSLVALFKRGLATLTTIAGNFAALATSAKQDTGNTSLGTIATNTGTANTNLSQLHTDLIAALPAGSNLIGGVNVQQGGNTLAVDASGAVTAHYAPSSTQSYTFTGAIALNTVVIAQVDCAQYRTARTHITSLGAGGVLQIQASNDGSNWTFINTCLETGASQIYQSNISATGAYVTALSGARYMRVIASTAYTSGTTSLTVQFSEQVAVNPFQNVYVQNSFPLLIQQSSGYGFSSYHTLVAAGSTNATNVRATTCTMGSCYLANTSAAFRYVKFYNKTGAPTVGTDIPALQFALPPNSAMNVETSFAGMRFTSGLSYCITAGSALLDTTAVTAGDVLVNLSYV